MTVSNKTVCVRCKGDGVMCYPDRLIDRQLMAHKHAKRICTNCCGIGIKYGLSRQLSFNEVAELQEFAQAHGVPKEFMS